MELVAPYIQHRAPEIADGWASDTALQRATSERPLASQQLRDRTVAFRNHMKTFLAESGDTETRLAFQTPSTWDDIANEAGEAVELFNREGQGHMWKRPFEKATYNFTNVACRLEFLMELLPDGEYTSILSGGLRLVFNAAKRLRQIRFTILQAFESLGQNIKNSKDYIRLYSNDAELRRRAEALFIAILEAVEAITVWIRKSPAKESFKAFFQQSDYGRKLADKITTNVETNAAAFDSRVRACLHIELRGVANDVRKVDGSISSLADNFRRDISALQETLAVAAREELDRKSTLEMLLAEHIKSARWWDQQLLAITARQTQIERRMLEDRQQPLQQTQVVHMQVIMPTSVLPQPLVTPGQLLGLLEYPPNAYVQRNQMSFAAQQALPAAQSTGPEAAESFEEQSLLKSMEKDNEEVAYAGLQMASAEQNRIALLLIDPSFTEWFRSAQSAALVVQGNERGHAATSAISPTSYMCSLLSGILRRLNVPSPLVYYCGLHSGADAAAGGPTTLIRSLIVQLLVNYDGLVTTDSLNNAEILEMVRRHDHMYLCGLFYELVMSFREPAVVCCMVDGVSAYEGDGPADQSARARAMAHVMETLGSLTMQQSKVVFKLIITDGSISRSATTWLPRAREVTLPEHNWLGGGPMALDNLLQTLQDNSPVGDQR